MCGPTPRRGDADGKLSGRPHIRSFPPRAVEGRVTAILVTVGRRQTGGGVARRRGGPQRGGHRFWRGKILRGGGAVRTVPLHRTGATCVPRRLRTRSRAPVRCERSRPLRSRRTG